MQAASDAYKEMMRRKFRNPLSYMRVTIGLINQQAQASAVIQNSGNYEYYSNLKKPLDNYKADELYVSCDQDYSAVDGSMYFLPRDKENVVLNQGIVTANLFGSIEICFPNPYDIKGLTVEFGKAYPVDFSIVSDNGILEVTGNADGHYVTEEIFEAATFIRFVPKTMVNGQSRFRINQITMGIGVYFDSRNILNATKKEHISPISEELPSIDFNMTVRNRNRIYDVENDASTINFLEIGQEIEVLYGQELDDGTIEWIPGINLELKQWSADDEKMSLSATDRFDNMEGTYYRGLYRAEGISLYELAEDVFFDAAVDIRDYAIDPYLKDVRIFNPMPVVSHKEALQLIANAGRCILYQDRTGKIILKSSFVPDMTASSDNELYFSNVGNILDGTPKISYAMTAENYTDVTPTQYFVPRNTQNAVYLYTGYISSAAAGEEGLFTENPVVKISLETVFKCFGMMFEFGGNPPESFTIHVYNNDQLMEDYLVSSVSKMTMLNHEFPEFDTLEVEFTKGSLHNRVVLNNIFFGDRTDYRMEYGRELTQTPEGTRLSKVQELQVERMIYSQTGEEKELTRENVVVSAEGEEYTVYLSNPSYDFSAMLNEPQAGQNVKIIDSSSYYVTLAFSGISGTVEVILSGKEYVITKAKVVKQLNPTGSVEFWQNPLVSSVSHAADLAEWIGEYMASDREYSLSYRGEPRIDANDIVFLENKYIPELLVRITDHTLKYSGGYSGTIQARRDMSNVAAAKD